MSRLPAERDAASRPPWRRALGRLLTPVSRALARLRDPARLAERFADPAEAGRLRLFVVSTPGEEALVRANVGSLAEHAHLCLLLNGYTRSAARRLARELAPVPAQRLSALPGFPLRHGTVLSLLLGAASEEFGVLDADCFVRDPRLVRRPSFSARELLAAPDHPQFWNVNRVTGRRFPRTHFLIFNLPVVRRVMRRYAVDAEKVTRVPRRLAAALAAEGYGEHNYPRSHLRFFDTLLLLMALAFRDGLEVRWLPVEDGRDQILHWKEQAELVRALGERARAAVAFRREARPPQAEAPPAEAAGMPPPPTGTVSGALPGSVLICHAHLDRYSGSELCALELAEELARRGVRVAMLTRRLRRPLRRDLAAAGLEVFHPRRPPPAGTTFDLVVNFHREMERALERYRVGAGRRVFYALSPFSRSSVPGRRDGFYDRLLAVSEETCAALAARGLDGAAVEPNWATDEMYDAYGPRPPGGLRRILCVSNHLPAELRRLPRPLRERGAAIRFVGRRTGGAVRRVDARLVAAHDMVISIGKTVQYALAAGVPVYCYDRWGGHGYLDVAALDHAEPTNFSGRCCGRRLTAEEMAAELAAGFEAAFAAREALHVEASRRYRLAARLSRLL